MNTDAKNPTSLNRRGFMATGTALATTPVLMGNDESRNPEAESDVVVTPAGDRRILLSCKLTMITKEANGQPLSIVERLRMAADAGFDGVDFDEAGNFSVNEVRAAVLESRVFVHNAINHAHWSERLTSANEAQRAQGRANIEHCIRVSHAAGGNGVLIVVGKADDGSADGVQQRCRKEIQRLLPLAAALGQPILIENVWNQIGYNHEAPPEQTADQYVDFVDSFNSPWVGMYYDIGNHWKYGQPREWLRAFGYRCVKLDVKGFSRAQDKFTDIGEGDLPWDEVRKGLDDIGFTGWTTAEVKGGDLQRLTVVRQQMQEAFGV